MASSLTPPRRSARSPADAAGDPQAGPPSPRTMTAAKTAGGKTGRAGQTAAPASVDATASGQPAAARKTRRKPAAPASVAPAQASAEAADR